MLSAEKVGGGIQRECSTCVFTYLLRVLEYCQRKNSRALRVTIYQLMEVAKHLRITPKDNTQG